MLIALGSSMHSVLSFVEPTPVVVAHLIPPVVTIVLSSVLGVWIWRAHRTVRGVRLYILLILVGAIVWQLQIVALILTTDWRLARFLVTSEKITGFLASFIWVFFIAKYTDDARLQSRWVYGLFVLVMAGLLIAAVTNPAHELFMIDILRVEEPFFHGSAVRGPVYYVFLGIDYAYVLAGLYVITRFLLMTRRSARARIALLAVGAVCVGIGNLASVAGLGPVSTFQYGGYGAFPFILATTFGVFRMGLLDLAPIARTTLVETLNDAVIVLDQEDRVVDYNRQALELWPSLSDKEGAAFSDACPELARLVDFERTGARTREITLTIDGATRWFSLLISPIERSGDESSATGRSLLLRDVTDLERSRQQLAAQNERLEQFAKVASHDLRNPLNVAQGRIELARSDHEIEHLDVAADAIDRSFDLIDDLLVLARAGQDVSETEPVFLPVLVEDCWETVETSDATIEIEREWTIEADRSRLRQLLENLFRNSIEHGGEGLAVRVGPLSDGFYVEDTGSGIPEEKRAQVFQEGYSESDDGTGFGLSIVQQIVQAHGWTVTLTESAEGGARFELTGVDVVDKE